MLRAKLTEAVDEELSPDRLRECEVVILALYPKDSVCWLRENGAQIRKGALVVDCCGVKKYVCDSARELAAENGFVVGGGHPMAGIERSGFEFSNGAMFRCASMILTPYGDTDIRVIERAKQFFLSVGFGRITICTPEKHDRIISYTSQLAHVLSNACIKSPTAPCHSGLSAGSFRDMTRVATLNPAMWTELFFENRDNLITEIDALAERLTEYSCALKNDADGLRRLLEDGVMMKALCDKSEAATACPPEWSALGACRKEERRSMRLPEAVCQQRTSANFRRPCRRESRSTHFAEQTQCKEESWKKEI